MREEDEDSILDRLFKNKNLLFRVIREKENLNIWKKLLSQNLIQMRTELAFLKQNITR